MVGESGSATLWGWSRRGLGAARGSGACCGAADCFVGYASPRAAAPGRLPASTGNPASPDTCTGCLSKWARRVGGRLRLYHRGGASAFVPGACGTASWQASDSRRGRALGCAQGTTSAGYPARRRPELRRYRCAGQTIALNCSKTGPLSPRTPIQNPEIPNF